MAVLKNIVAFLQFELMIAEISPSMSVSNMSVAAMRWRGYG